MSEGTGLVAKDKVKYHVINSNPSVISLIILRITSYDTGLVDGDCENAAHNGYLISKMAPLAKNL